MSDFDPNKPYITRNGCEVISHRFKDKIMGVVVYDEEEGVFSVWDLKGEKIMLFPRKKNEVHDLDLINIEEG